MQNNTISLFVPTLEVGGAEKVMLNLANGIIKAGYNVDMVLVKAKGEYLKNIDEKVNIVDLNSNSAMGSIGSLSKYLKEKQPLAMISAIENCNVAAIIANKIAKVDTKIIVTIHTTLSRVLEDVKNIKVKLNMILQKLLYKNAFKIVSVSKATAEDASITLNIPLDKIDVIYNPIINQSIIEKSNDIIDDIYFNDDTITNILAVGRLTEAKSFDTLIKAVNILLKDRKDVRLTIIGEGPKREELERLAKDLKIDSYVDMPGFKDNPYSYMSKCDVFVLSSKWEGLPSVIIEAMACGADIVATDCKSGPREILEDGKYGILTPVGDEHKLANAINQSLSTDKNIDGIDKHLDQFSFDKIIEKYINLIKCNN
ncbi:glycosyltransferase [Paraclostridium bifermentans]|uniref:glycosyltransferase n=1 Tax=Paraclostridium bifermentans TaxID=1490 RepID=UPI00374EA1FE